MSEETRVEAERISADLGYHGGWQNQQALTDAIDRALQIREERTVRNVWLEVLKIAESHLEGPGFGFLLRDKLRAAAIQSVVLKEAKIEKSVVES